MKPYLTTPSFHFLFLPFLIFFAGVGCNTLPKGEYSRSFIERPYSLPDDVAIASLGVNGISQSVKEESGNNTFESEDDNNALVFANFENGINNNLSWVYPLGVKWTLLNEGRHTLGVSASTVFIYNYFKLDYWYKLSAQLSLRPFYQVTQFDFIFLREKRKLLGLDFVWQANKHFSVTFKGFTGEYEGSSGVIEDILSDIFGSSTSSEVIGDIKGGGLGFLYSISDQMDLVLEATYSQIEDSAVNSSNYSLTIDETEGRLGFNFIW